jgi:polyphosphate kinase
MGVDPALYINRELSWLEFNARVLHEAFDPRNRLLERLKFLAIFSTNLDEFHMVRVAGLRRQIAAGVEHLAPDGIAPAQQLAAITARVAGLMEQQRRCLYDLLLPELEKNGIKLVRVTDLTPKERQIADQFFTTEVLPVLTPVTIEPGQPFPYISNLALSLAVQIYDPASGSSRFARVKVPKRLPRWFPFGQPGQFVPLEQIIGANLGALFPGMEIRCFNTFRVIRYSDFEVFHSGDDDELLTMIE